MRCRRDFAGVLLIFQAVIATGAELPPLDVNLPAELTTETLIVGTKESPPFAMKNTDGTWSGISIELWAHAAEQLGLAYEYQEATLNELTSGLETGELDAAVAAISVTAERQQRIEFCHPHYPTGLGIAVRSNARGDAWDLIRRVVTWRLLGLVAAMILLVVVCGLLFWKVERHVNQNMFGSKRRQGIEMGIWWSTILLLGHKGVSPVSTIGRLVAFSAMLASILLLSLLTGVITSVLTVQQLDLGIEGPSDLRQSRVVTVASSTASDYLRQRRIQHRTLPDAETAMQAVVDGKADAVVYDRPLLQYLSNEEFAATIKVLSTSFNAQDYAIALPPQSALRKPLNTVILRYRSSDSWDDLVFRYLGE